MTITSSRPYEHTSKELLKDPQTAVMYLQEILAEGDVELFKEAVRDIPIALRLMNSPEAV